MRKGCLSFEAAISCNCLHSLTVIQRVRNHLWMSEVNLDYWRKCSSCKKPIGYSTNHYVCSVSTCNRKRTGYVFDSVLCFERHLPGARHRDAGAVETKSPTYEQWKTEVESDVAPSSAPQALAREPQRVIVRSATPGSPSVQATKAIPKDALESEILVVVSKMKNYVRERSEMNTSDSVMQLLSNRLRRLCDRAIENARSDGRKTVMDRDFEG